MSKYKNAVCRGCWALGNNCGTCEKCCRTKPDKQDLVDRLESSKDDIDQAIKRAEKNVAICGKISTGDLACISRTFQEAVRALNAKPDTDTIESQAAEIAFEETRVADLMNTIAKQDRDIASKQARIDELMFEFCEDEMTQEQMDNWAVHQVVAKHKVVES